MFSLLTCGLALSGLAEVVGGVNVADFINKGIGVEDAAVASSTSSSNPLITAAPTRHLNSSSVNGAPPGETPIFTVDNTTHYSCTSTGIASAAACSSSWTSWSSASESFISQHISTYTTTTVIPPPNYVFGPFSYLGAPWANASTPYATCNDIPRYSGGWTLTGSSTIAQGASQTVDIIATRTLSTFPEPAPTCCMGPADCLTLQNDWHAANPLLYPFNVSFGQNWLDNIPPPSYPHCNSSQMLFYNQDCSGCWVKAGNAKILYWPQPVESAPVCAQSYVFGNPSTSAAANVTGPVTAVVNYTDSLAATPVQTTTLTSPTVYLSAIDIDGFNACGEIYGTPTAGIFPLQPEELQSAILDFPGMTDEAASSSFASIIAYQQTEKYTDLFGVGWQTRTASNAVAVPLTTKLVPINMADFNQPPPFLSYYLGDVADYCLNGDLGEGGTVYPMGLPCNTIFDYYNTPQVRLGTAVKSMEKAFATCQVEFGWDPPSALTPANSVVGPGLPHSTPPVTTPTPKTTPSVGPPQPDSQTTPRPCSTPDPNTAPSTAPNPKPTTSPDAPSQTAPAPGSPSSQPAGGNSQPAQSNPGGGGGGGGNSQPAPQPSPTTSPAAVITIGSSIVTATQGHTIVVGSQTLTPGGSAVTIGSQTVSVGSSGVVVGSSTAAFTTNTDIPAPPAVSSATFVAGGSSLTAVESGSIVQVIGSGGSVIATLTEGGSAATVAGQTVSAGSGGLQVGTSNVALTPGSVDGDATTVTIDNQVYTASELPGGEEVIDGSITLTAGGKATTLPNGEVMSAGSSGEVVIGSTTLQMPTAATTDPSSGNGDSGASSSSVRLQVGLGSLGLVSLMGVLVLL